MVDPRMNVLIEQGVLGELFSVGEATGHCGILHGTVLPRDFCVSENGVLWKPQFWGIPLCCGKPNVCEDVPRCCKMFAGAPIGAVSNAHPLASASGAGRSQHRGHPQTASNSNFLG